MQLSPIVTFGPMVQFSMETFFPMMHGGNQPGIVNGIALVDSGAADIVEFRAFPGQGRGRALAARKRGLTPLFPRLEGRAQDTGGPPGPTGFHP